VIAAPRSENELASQARARRSADLARVADRDSLETVSRKELMRRI
jgi:hypothetical protein